MDISSLNTKTGAEDGAFMQLRHPVYLHPLFDEDEKPVGLFVRGMESETVRRRVKKLAPKADAEQSGLDFVVSLVSGVQGLERGNDPLTTDRADLEWFFQQSDSFVEQVLEFARDRANFFGRAATV